VQEGKNRAAKLGIGVVDIGCSYWSPSTVGCDVDHIALREYASSGKPQTSKQIADVLYLSAGKEAKS
jgi:hypothetical protein